VDLLRASFPGGSITGAPKIRAMEIIDELEPVKPGFHGGAHGHRDHALMSRFVEFAIDEKLKELNATDAQKQKVLEVKERLMREGKALHEDHGALHDQLLEWSRTLEERVREKVAEVERLGRLKRFFSPPLAELIVAGGADDPLKTHRREITVVFLDARGLTALADTPGPGGVRPGPWGSGPGPLSASPAGRAGRRTRRRPCATRP